jgi:hypothetical protein
VSGLYRRLIGPGDRKSVQPMAARAGEVGYDQLHHFVAAGVWDSAPLEAALLKKADGLVGDEAGFLVINDTALRAEPLNEIMRERIVEYRTLLFARISFSSLSFDSEATVEDVKQLILEHDGTTHPSECFADLLMLFNAAQDDLDSLLPVIQDAWNYFPHRSLPVAAPQR